MVDVSGDVIATKPVLGGTLKLWRYAEEGGWTEEDDFGATGNFSLHGDTLLIGDSQDDGKGENAGAASIYRFDGDSWELEQTLRASDGEAGDLFGIYARLIEDRALLISWNDMGGLRSAYVFDYNGSTWSETEKLVTSDGEIGDQFGAGGWAISHESALIGASSYDFDEDNQGAAYSFNVPVPEPSASVLAMTALVSLAALMRARGRRPRDCSRRDR